MGAFALIRKEPGSTLPDRVSATLRQRGFPAPRRIDTRDHILLLADKMISPVPNFFSDESGDFAAATGTLFYRDSFGLSALAHLLADARADRIDETAFFGSYAAIVKTGLKLVLFGDGLGTYRIYRTADDALWSSSFLACLRAVSNPVFDTQAVHEYVFNGTTFGGASLVEGISLLDPAQRIRLEPGLLPEPRETAVAPAVTADPLAVHVDRTLAVLRRHAHSIAQAFGNNIDITLSGDHDTRLTLALLRTQGVLPHIRVAGSADDRKVARAIAAGEGLKLEYDFKNISEDIDISILKSNIETAFWTMDGCPPAGIIPTDHSPEPDPRSRDRGRLSLASDGGQVLRNFLALPPRAFPLSDLRRLLLGPLNEKACRAADMASTFAHNIDHKLAALFPHAHRELTRVQIEYLYPAFRGRSLDGLEQSLANCFAPSLSPFLDLSVVRESIHVPMRFKNHGIFAAALIAASDPRLAAYPASGGHDLIGRPPLGKRIADWLFYLMPVPLRMVTKSVRELPKKFEASRYCTAEMRKQYLPEATPVMDRYFDLAAFRDNVQIRRVLTLEILASRMGVRAA